MAMVTPRQAAASILDEKPVMDDGIRAAKIEDGDGGARQ